LTTARSFRPSGVSIITASWISAEIVRAWCFPRMMWPVFFYNTAPNSSLYPEIVSDEGFAGQ
jgi:hypothetical protein